MTVKEVIVKQLAEKDPKDLPEYFLEVLEKCMVEVDGKQFISIDKYSEHFGVDKQEFMVEAMSFTSE